jgi:hypothetical protein
MALDPQLAELLARAGRNELDHEEVVDMMLRGRARYNLPSMPRDTLLAIVKQRCPTPAALSSFVQQAYLAMLNPGVMPGN